MKKPDRRSARAVRFAVAAGLSLALRVVASGADAVALTAITGQQLDRGAAALQAYLQYTPQGQEPGIAPAHWRLGMIREKQGDRAAARAEYEAALKLAPDFALVRESLAKLP